MLTPSAEDRNDVVIVGYGPVGMVLANLLAGHGWRVTVVERWTTPFGLPRAVAYDTEAGRILAAAGLDDFLVDFGECADEYTWSGPNGEVLLYSKIAERGWCYWPDSTSMYQPDLEEALTARGAELPTLHVLRGYEAVEIAAYEDGVRLMARGNDNVRELHASWVVGCDGANSFVRHSIGSAVTDFDFAHDWLICDVVLHEDREFVPNNLQICDPARPRTAVSAGPGHRRWEFMRVPGESIVDLDNEAAAWRLLRGCGVTPANATLDRFAVYRFGARYVDRWRSGRLLLAGDAAHLMPPFAGQGMSSGFRDAANLAWKLDRVLAGRADAELLDSYTEERTMHVRHAVESSIQLGKVICQVDEQEAADLHEVLLAARERGLAKNAARPGVHPLASGFLDGAAPGAGELTPQGWVRVDGRSGLFDVLVGRGWTLLTTVPPSQLLDDDSLEFLRELPANLAHLVPAGAPSGVVDLDEVYLPFLAQWNAVAMLVRPDFYVYGAAADAAECARLVAGLRERLGQAVLTP